MKRIWIYSMVLLALLPAAGCNKWLDVLPENQQVTDLYWQDKEEAEAVLGAAYVRFRGTLQRQLIWGEARGNGLALLGSVPASIFRLKQFEILPENEWAQWSSFYEVINYANMVIKYAPEVVVRDPSFSQPVMQSLLSEAYFLRGLCYFILVRNFREVPLITEPYMNDLYTFDVAKSAEAEIYQQIISDLETAIPASKEVWPQVWENKGRATKWAIYALLADVYLWTEQYEQAIAACDQVLQSGWVGLLDGMVNNRNQWFTIFSEGNSNESIFELQFDFARQQTNEMTQWFSTGSYTWIISPLMVERFDLSAEDIRGDGASYNAGTFRLWKYLGAEANTTVPRPNNDQNWILYRMADIYLMKAEALIMLGESNYAEALTLVNRIRQRAGISVPVGLGSSELEMLDIVLNERALEFLGEGKRWYDILRVAKRNQYQYKEYLISQVLLGVQGGSAPVIRSKLLNENSHYLPIHINELLSNRLLKQNPYYDNVN
ncbi:RagB/SusD family nutrient uptake outer membrane protein [Parapedobacter deserti]|uniref:RagB/SusD family nutrient uptake outer membrane protein n=1 Tax=Parapedobacter deserti TaxID=1912957 RepID=A0ABV7JLZ9_9SPHI